MSNVVITNVSQFNPPALGPNTIMYFNGFSVLKGVFGTEEHFVVDSMNVWDYPEMNSEKYSNNIIRGAVFSDCSWGFKRIEITGHMFPSATYTYAQLVTSLKDIFYKCKDTLYYVNRCELMRLEAEVQGLKFNRRDKKFTVSFVAEPYFTSPETATVTSSFATTSGTIDFNNEGHRIDPILTITVTGDTDSLTVGDLQIKARVTTGDSLVVNFEEQKTYLNGVEVSTTGTYKNFECVNESIDVSSSGTNTTFPAYDQTTNVLGGDDGDDIFIVSDSFKVWEQEFDVTGITNLKQLTIYGVKNSVHSVKFDIEVSATLGGTVLGSTSKTILAGVTANNSTAGDPENTELLDFTFDGLGVDLSALTTAFVKVTYSYVGTIGAATLYFLPMVTAANTGLNYVIIDGLTKNYAANWELQGISTAYTGTTTNVTAIDVTSDYTNKYL